MRSAAIISARIAATVSAILTIRAGRNSHSLSLIVLMTAWVIAPFIALLIGSRRFPRRSVYVLTLAISICSIAAYIIDAFEPPKTKAAQVFVVVPLVSWVVGAIVLGAVFFARRRRA